MLFILNSFDPRADIEKHPKMILIFNDVSLYKDGESLEKIREQKKEAFKSNKERLS